MKKEMEEDKGLMFGHLSAPPPPPMPTADPHSDQPNSSAPTMPPRKNKKVTSHWRDFIRPIMWRCKWAELKMKQIEAYALSCTENVDQNDQHLDDDQTLSVTSESPPVNEMDPESYMANHVLFSYHGNGGSSADVFDGLVVRDSQEKVGFDMQNSRLFVEDKDDDMLRKIDAAQTRVQKLKAQVGVVISKNVDPFEAQILTEFGFHIPQSTEAGLPSQVADNSYGNAKSS